MSDEQVFSDSDGKFQTLTVTFSLRLKDVRKIVPAMKRDDSVQHVLQSHESPSLLQLPSHHNAS